MGKTKSASVILLDIEGTTTSISFVKDVLFPYARHHLAQYLREELGEDSCNDAVQEMMGPNFNIYRGRTRKGKEYAIHQIATEVNRLMDADVKSSGLKTLQGLIWKAAYESGAVKGHLFSDVKPAFSRWIDEGRRIFIYSSGSVFAQKLLFGNSVDGNLSSMIEGHFDTGIGSKLEAESYKKIIKEIGVTANDIVFLTDNPKEAEASEAAGIKSLILDRPGNAELSSNVRASYQVLKNLTEVKV